MKKFLLIIFCTCFWFVNVTPAQNIPSGAGTASGLILRFDPNPRVAGLSSAFTALADDENALLYNPAALSNFRQGIISLNHTQWFADIKIDNLTFGYQLTPKIGLGLALTHLWMPAIEIPLTEMGDQTAAATVSSSVIQLGMGYSITPLIRAGVAVKYLMDKLDDYNANAFGADVGLHFKLVQNRLHLGLALQNLGSTMKFDVEEQDIPQTFRGGIAYTFIDPDLNLSVDVLKSSDTDIMILSGVEYTFLKQFSIRIGNRYSSYESFNPAFGVGFALEQKYVLNYSYMNFSELGGTHRIGFSFRFDTPSTNKKTLLLDDGAHTVQLIPPSEVNVEITGDELHISWSRVAGVQYNVYARHSSQAQWIKLNQEVLYNNRMVFKKPTTKGKYSFKVGSVREGQESSHSKEVSIDVE